jgi:hypothetical protein
MRPGRAAASPVPPPDHGVIHPSAPSTPSSTTQDVPPLQQKPPHRQPSGHEKPLGADVRSSCCMKVTPMKNCNYRLFFKARQAPPMDSDPVRRSCLYWIRPSRRRHSQCRHRCFYWLNCLPACCPHHPRCQRCRPRRSSRTDQLNPRIGRCFRARQLARHPSNFDRCILNRS